ncbi:MAG: DNA starvation/stationary phase protection protein [Alphaproteobacteria bacterium]|nr:DNA starvation/stationary phase protection protein [Alphaproteobacteria bacterium]
MAVKKPMKKTVKQAVVEKTLVEHLAGVLSDTYVLAIKTHGYHWNVTGPLFPQLHSFFEQQYSALFEAADELAERIRALGHFAPPSATAFLVQTVVREAVTGKLTAASMLQDLLKSQQLVRNRVEEARAVADRDGDKATEDMLIGRLEDHDKMIWMIRSQLDA